MRKFYRVCNTDTNQGLWYHFNGCFSGLIHKEFDFCKNRDLKMDFDSELVGWLSVAESLEDLYKWFPKEDILKLQEDNWMIHEYECSDYKFYHRFQHYVINQDNCKLISKIKL